MTALTSGRCLAGSKAFTGVRPRQLPAVSNGSKIFMRRKDSYMVEVNVGEDEPEDIAVRKFMKKVMDSRVIDQLRTRRYFEPPRDEFKRRTRERIEKIKNQVVEATWEEEYGPNSEVMPFADFFPSDEFGIDFLNSNYLYGNDAFLSQGGYLDAGAGDNMWGGYANARTGGYMNQGGFYDSGYAAPVGGYYNQQPGYYQEQGGYTQPASLEQGGYAQPPAAAQ